MITTNWAINFAPVMMMLVIVVMNHMLTHHRSGQRDDVEEARLRAALLAELRALRDAYRKNIDLIDAGAGCLISTRAPVIIYKSNQGKLLSVFEVAALEKIVAVYARNEIMEATLSASAQPHGGLSFKLAPDTDTAPLRQMYAEGVQQVTRTCRALVPEETDAQAARARPRVASETAPSPAVSEAGRQNSK
jgi:hypothetical protein